MRKYLLLITLITFTVGTTWAQSSKSKANVFPELSMGTKTSSHNESVQRDAGDYIRCFTEESEAERKANDNSIPSKADFEQWIARKIEEQKQSGETQRATYNIPYIVHVVHDGESIGSGDNISAAQIYAQIQQINSDFQRLNSDAANTPAVFAGVAGSIDLQFIPAIEDEAGNALSTPGINRVNRNTMGWSAPPYGTCVGGDFGNDYIQNTIKPDTYWDPERFFNIWVMDISCGILGYAQFPSSSGLDGLATDGGSASTDGVVLLSSSVGSISSPGATAPYNLGRTATHEIGHWLGLRHIWGDGDCSADDYCDDTPTTGSANYSGSPCTFPGTNSCNDGAGDLADMFQNYMDYSDDECMNLFTQDQISRVQAVLANSPRRLELLSSTTGGEGTGGACIVWTDPTPTTGWIDFNNDFGGAPCDDGTGCAFNEITSFEIWASEAYQVENFVAGGTYTFSMCNGPGAGSWVPEFTVMAPSGVIDAFGAGDGDGCSITWTASESGTYFIIINEEGACGTANTIDNGYPALTCTEGTEVLCTPSDCVAGSLVDTDSVGVCGLEETASIEITGESVPTDGSYSVSFSPDPSNANPGANITGFSVAGTLPVFTFDSDVNGILSFNGFPPMSGLWIVTGFVRDENSDVCDISDDSKLVNFLDAGDPACAAAAECDPPTDLLVDNITSSSADFSWTGNGSEASFDVELVDITAGGSPTGNPTESDVNNPHGFTGLASNNDYAAYVRGNCEEETVDLVLTGIVDGDVPGGLPKAIEIYVIKDIADLSIYGFGSANNGGGSDGQEFAFSGSATAGDYLYVTSNLDAFSDFFGFAADFDAGSAAGINGDDAIELFKNGVVVDVYGDINVNGDGEVWDYTDGWAYRIDATGPDGSTFQPSSWTYSGLGGLDDEIDNATATNPVPVGTYAFTTREASDWAGPFNFTTLEEVAEVPANDSCAGAITVSCGDDFGSVGASEATEDDAPQGCSGSGAGLWYTFEGDDQTWEITATPFGWDNEIHVYSGDCDNLDCEANADSGLSGDAETVSLVAESGTTYYIYVGGWGLGQSADSFNLSIECTGVVEAPANDSCGGAITVSCGDDFGSVGASEATEDDAPQGCSGSGAGLWYTFEGDDQTWEITATPFGWDNEIHVYSGDCDNLDCEANADSGLSGDAETVSLVAESGTTYYIYVGGWGLGQSADSFNLSIECTEIIEAPANDSCGGAITVSCGDDFGSVGASAATEDDAPQGCSGSGAGLWYTFEGDDQTWEITATPFGWDNEIHVYSGDCDNLECEANADSGLSGDAETVSLVAESGTTYYIYVGGWGAGQSADSFNLAITCTPPITCPAPTALLIENITLSSADLSWTPVGEETEWDLEIVDITAGGSFTGTPTVTGLTDTFYLATGLAEDNEYEFYVVANCDDSSSEWAGPEAFETLSSTPEPCLDYENPTAVVGWQDFNNIYGGAPCDDGSGCPFNEITDFEVWASEAYEVIDFVAGGEYTFSMCNGPGAGSWTPEFTVVAPSGAVDAFGAGDGDGCSITWTASESGTYLIIINEAGFCGTGSPNTATDNGYPALTCTSGGLAVCAPVEPAPANDTCGGAVTIACGDDFGSVGATEATDADAPQGCSTSGAGLWYTFEGDDQTWDITATPFGWDNEIHVYSGDCDNLVCEDWADGGLDDDPETASVNTVSGTTYYVYVGGWGTGETEIDSFNLSVVCSETPEAPVNDTCGGAIELTIGTAESCDGGAGFVSTSTASATQTTITTCDGSLEDDADLWYFFTATSEAIQFNSLTGLPGIEIFDGSCGNLGNTVGCLNNLSGTIEGLTVGNDYYAVVWTDGQQPTVEFCIEEVVLAECEAGTATSTDSIALCPDSIATFTTLGDSIVPVGGEYGIFFEAGPDGGGALGDDFVLLDINTPYSFDSDLNGVLSSNAFPEFTGTWYVYGAVYRDPLDAFNTICDLTDEYLVVTFLEAGEGDCAPPPPVPSNDSCGGAIALSCGDDFGVFAETATDIDAPQGCSASGAGLWYTFEGDDQNWEITATPFGWDNEIHVYSGVCGDLACEVSADLGFTDDAETVSLETTAGTTYYVYVGGWGTSVTEIDSFNIAVVCTPPTPDPACGTVLYDNGGPSGNYAPNSNDTVTICPDNPGDVVTLEFTFVDIETSTGGAANGCWDYLTIYNGANTDADVLSGALCGEGSGDGGTPWIPEALLEVGDIFTSTDASGCLTVVFQSDGTIQEGGYAADITCAPAPVCETPIELNVENITETSADLSWTPGSDESLFHLEIVDVTAGGTFTGTPTVSSLTDTFYLATGLTPGNDYSFYVIADCEADSSDWAGPENFTTLVPIPANDTCGGAITVECGTDMDVEASDATDTDAPQGCSSSGAGLWYTFEGDGQDWEITATPFGWDNEIHIYSGTCDDLTCETSEDSGFSGDAETATVSSIPGTTYYVYVGGWGTSVTEIDDFNLSIVCTTPPPAPVNDTCSGAITVSCDDVVTGSTEFANNEPDIDFCGTDLSAGPGVWYVFEGTGDDVTFSLCGSSFDTKIGVFTGSCGDLTCVDGNDDECSLQSEVEVPTEVGTDYYVYVTGYVSPFGGDPEAGEFTLAVTCVEPACDTASISAVITDSDCGIDGAIDVTIEGGSGSFDVEWSTGETVEDLTDLAPGEYTIYVTDVEDGCPAMATFIVEGNDPLEEPVPAAITTNGCDGSGTGATIDVTISGGTEPYTYLWSNGADTEDLVGLSSGDYTLDVTDANGCTYTTATFNIPDQPGIFEVVDAVVVDVDCNGEATGSIDITLGGGVPPYIIRWSNDLHTEDISGLVAGTYVFFATDQTGCEYLSGEIVVNEPDAISEANMGVVTNADCNGAATGSVDITITGGTAPYTYLWTNGSTEEDPTDLSAGAHQATVTDANGCTFLTAVYVIDEPTQIAQAGAVVTDADCNGASTGAVDITVSGGTPGYTFVWSDGSMDEDLVDVPAGDYTVEITDANGCVINAGPFTVGEPSAVMVTASSVIDVTCNGEATGAVNISVAGGTAPYTYNWDNGSGTQDLVDVAAGDYTVTITDANGCVVVDGPYTVSEPDALTIPIITATDADCNGAATGMIDIAPAGGTAPYTYEWSNGGTETAIVDLVAGTYSVTVTDANGCTVESGDIEVGEPDALLITSTETTPVTCNGGSDGTTDIEVAGGTEPYTYEWSNAEITEDLTDVAAGDYIVTVTDANGCEVSTTVTVVEPEVIFESLPPTVVDVTCNGNGDGSITANLQGGTLPYTITWSNSETGETVSGLSPGTYTYSVVDANGCTFDSDEIEVSEPDALVVTGESTDIACFGESTGTVSVTVEGGTPEYSYVWSNGGTTATISGLDAGDYSVTVTDANGCTVTSETFTVSAPASELTATVEVTDASGNGVDDGSITATATGGDEPYTYAWQGGFGFGATLTDIEPGIYCVDVTDANGCVVTACGTVGFPTAIKDLLEISEITLYPNPTANITNLNIKLSKAADLQLAVVDIIGKTYQEQTVTNVEETEVQFDLTEFAAGTYFIRIAVDNEILSLPIVVQH